MGSRTLALSALALLLTGGCRDGVPPFTPAEREAAGQIYPLTFGYGQDADPQWSPTGDTVLYHTNLFDTMPASGGVLLGIPARGGTAAPVLPIVQDWIGPLATPAFSPTGDRVAYVHLMSVDVPGPCFRIQRTPAGDELEPTCRSIQPLLDSAVLRVSRIGEARNVSLDPQLVVRFAGTDMSPGSPDEPWYTQLFPFQAEHRTHDAMLFRPSWAPDGERIAFSDGLAIHTWRIGEPAASVVPGTADGVSAAWSPDGEWIAFTQMTRADSIVYECNCTFVKTLVKAYRTVYAAGPRTLVLVRPDGSDRIELGEGQDPAWSPDGDFLFARRGNEIVRVARGDGTAMPVSNTEGGRSPAVSPDGEWLAFSRSKNQLTVDYDIWVVSLAQ